MITRYSFIFIIIPLLFMSCTETEEVSFEEYYFQMDQFENTQVYQFECPEFGLVEYWEMTYFPSDSSFHTKVYNEELEEQYFMKEKISNQGAKVSAFGRINTKPFENGLITTDKVLQNDAFLWNSEEPYYYQLEFNSNGEDHQLYERERTFVDFETITVSEIEYETIHFQDKFTLENLTTGEKSIRSNNSFYAKGFGCVLIQLDGMDGTFGDLKLTRILNGGEWAQKLAGGKTNS